LKGKFFKEQQKTEQKNTLKILGVLKQAFRGEILPSKYHFSDTSKFLFDF
jgi:hypothetical protein